VILTKTDQQYLETILWAETVSLPWSESALNDGCAPVTDDHILYGVEEGAPLDKYFSIWDFTRESVREALTDLASFFSILQEKGIYETALEYGDDTDIAHNFWLTRNRHGAGFWDGDYGNIGDALTEVAHSFGERYILVNEEGDLEIYK
jgi:hypothetical protein